MSLNFDNGVTKELKWSSIVWNVTPSDLPAGSGAVAVVSLVNGQPVASTSSPALPQQRPQAPPTTPRGAITQRPSHPNSGPGALPQHPSKAPRGSRPPTGHPRYGQPYPHSNLPPGAPYMGHPPHPYPTPSSSSNNTPSNNINFMHYQPPPPKSDSKPTVNAYYRPRPALDAEARMQQMAQYPQAPQSSRAPLSPVSPTRDSSTQLPRGAPILMKPVASMNESPVTNQLPTPKQSGNTPP